MTAPKLDASEIEAHLNAMSRQPFRELLGTLLGAFPDPETLAEWAKKSPDRYAQALAILGRLSGYTEKSEVFHEVRDYSHMSDAELMAEIETMDGELGKNSVLNGTGS